jgi:ethanolaminephosphotransferase
MWMAPNMVTLLGFMWIVANVFIIEIFVPDMVGPVSICFWLGWKWRVNMFNPGSRVDLLQFRSWHVDVSEVY